MLLLGVAATAAVATFATVQPAAVGRYRPLRRRIVPAHLPAAARGAQPQPGQPQGTARIAVQPFEGPDGDVVRSAIARIVRDHGFHPITSLPHYEGTAQLPALASQHDLTAFVTGDVEGRGRSRTVTILVWNGASASVAARWSMASAAPTLGRTLDKGFWKHLGEALLATSAPPRPVTEEPAPTMHINAAADDEALSREP